MKKYQLGSLIIGILFPLIIYAAEKPKKLFDLGINDIKIEIQRIDNEHDEFDAVAIGRIMVRINGKWLPFSNQRYLASGQWRAPVIIPVNNRNFQ